MRWGNWHAAPLKASAHSVYAVGMRGWAREWMRAKLYLSTDLTQPPN